MAIPARLTRTLQQALGDQGADDLMNWMLTAGSNRSEHRELAELYLAKIEARINELFAEHRQEGAKFRVETREALASIRVEIAQRSADLLKWSFVFWVGAIGAMAALAGLLN